MQIVVKRPFCPQVLELAHETMFSGHMGIKKIVDMILSNSLNLAGSEA